MALFRQDSLLGSEGRGWPPTRPKARTRQRINGSIGLIDSCEASLFVPVCVRRFVH
jgi:hypothetical protein